MGYLLQTIALAAALGAAAVGFPACTDSAPGASGNGTPETPVEDATTRLEDPIALPGPDSVVVDGFGKPTTGGTIALSNLSAQVEGHQNLVARFPGNVEFTSALVQLLLTRTQFAGSYDDFDEALALAENLVALHPDDGSAQSLLASVQGALHRFPEAGATLDRAEQLGADVAAQRETIDLARGRNLQALRDARAARVAELSSYQNLTALAGAEAALGNFDVADARFLDALDAYGDVSPLAVSWVAFQRGVMWAEHAGRDDLAEGLYLEAVRRLPGYVVANVHLSELEVGRGAVSEAQARLERVRTTTVDPEPTGYLAELLQPSSPEVAAQHADFARKAYDGLLTNYPEAFADHGSEFFSGPAGADPARGLTLALDNLERRKNDRAYTVAIAAAQAAGDQKLACTLSDEAGDDRASIPLAQVRRAVRLLGCN